MTAIGERRLSNGIRLSAVDWRANRLVDVLTKQAAATRQAPASVLQMLKSAKAAVRHSAAQLGEVIYSANNHRVVVTMPDGSQIARIICDAKPTELGAASQACFQVNCAAEACG